MNTRERTPRLLGAAFLVVAFSSLVSGLLRESAVGSGGMSDVLVRVAGAPDRLRTSNVVEMVTSAGIVVLAVLLYVVLREESRIVALVALGWWLAEAILLAASRIGTFALIPLGRDFVAAGAPQHSYYQAIGGLLYDGVYRQAYTMHMVFYCIGGILWYSLFYRSRYVPRAISLFGLAAATVALVGIVVELLGQDIPMLVFVPLGLFELTIGVWLLLRGIAEA